MALEGEELIRRFLLHVLPKGFMRVRHYGFLANSCRGKKLPTIRLGLEPQDAEAKTPRAVAAAHAETRIPAPKQDQQDYPCKKCRQGRLRVISIVPPLHEESG
jgi:hypothetical protein